MKTIPLTRGLATIIDDADYEWVSQFRWYARKGRKGSYYASRVMVIPTLNGGLRTSSREMQRDLLDPERKLLRSIKADHINGDTLDNRRGNLRISSDSASNANRRGWTAQAHGFKGVYYVNRPDYADRPYVVKIRHLGKQIYGAMQADPVSGAREYNRLALKFFGEFASLNEIPGDAA